MAVVCDFSVIKDDTAMPVPAVAGNGEVPLPDFETGGRRAQSPALLFLSARNLTGTATVRVNGNNVGSINSTSGVNWSTQLIHFSGAVLNDGNNEIVLRNVADGFEIKDVVCLFKQSI